MNLESLVRLWLVGQLIDRGLGILLTLAMLGAAGLMIKVVLKEFCRVFGF